MKDAGFYTGEKKPDIALDTESPIQTSNYELPAFKAIPSSAPLVAAKAGAISAILPWCC